VVSGDISLIPIFVWVFCWGGVKWECGRRKCQFSPSIAIGAYLLYEVPHWLYIDLYSLHRRIGAQSTFYKLKWSLLQWRQGSLELKYITKITLVIGSDEILNRPHVCIVNRPRPTRFVYWAFEQSGSSLFGISLLKFVLFEMYNYLSNFLPVLRGAP